MHPNLGLALKHLVIDATPHYSLQLWTMRRRSLDSRADAGHLAPVTDGEDGGNLRVRLDEEYEVLAQEAEGRAKWFNETRFDVVCLRKVFARVKTLESIVFAYDGMEIRYAKFAQRYCEASQHEMSRPFVSTLQALAAMGTRVKRLEIATGKGYGVVSVGRLESLAPSLRSFDYVFEKLERLELKFRDWRYPDTGFALESSRAPFVVRFLAKCRNVRVLDLSFYSAFEEDAFEGLAREGRLERLECVTLELFRVKWGEDLMAFLAPSERCLRELRLRHVLLDNPESTWKEIFVKLADEQTGFEALRILHAERLFTERSSGVKRLLFHDGTSSTSTLRVDGKHWRNELKECGCKYVESEAGRMWESGAISYPFMRSDST